MTPLSEIDRLLNLVDRIDEKAKGMRDHSVLCRVCREMFETSGEHLICEECSEKLKREAYDDQDIDWYK